MGRRILTKKRTKKIHHLEIDALNKKGIIYNVMLKSKNEHKVKERS